MSNDSYDFGKSVSEEAIAASNMVLRTLILIHGGAAVALLAFIGNLAGKSPPILSSKIATLAATLVWFGWGMASAVAAMAFAYFTHYLTVGHAFSDNAELTGRYGFWKTVLHVVAVAVAVLSLGLFLFGMYQVRDAILIVLR